MNYILLLLYNNKTIQFLITWTSKLIRFLLLVLLHLIVLPSISQAHLSKTEQSSNTNDIKLIDELGKEIIVSREDIKKRLLEGKAVHFVRGQEEEKKTIEAKLVSNALGKKAKIDIQNAIITGDLDLRAGAKKAPLEESGLEPERKKWLKRLGVKTALLIIPSISIKYSKVLGNLVGEGYIPAGYTVVFKKEINFFETSLQKETYFRVTNFLNFASFSNVKFQGIAYFPNVDFQEGAIFAGAEFKKLGIFSSANFHKDADFTLANFQDISDISFSDFSHANFYGKVCFESASFKNVCSFTDADFLRETDFKETKFMNETEFLSTTFSRAVSFKGAKFSKNANFRDATFFGRADFSEANFKEEGIFIGAIFGKEMGIDVDLTMASYKKLRIYWHQLEGRLDWPLEIMLRDTEKKEKAKYSDFVEWMEVYIRLIKNFKDIGDNESANNAYYHYKTKKIVSENWFIKIVEWFFLDLTCGYGVKPINTLKFTGWSIFFFFLIYSLVIVSPTRFKVSLEYHNADRCFSKEPLLSKLFNCLYFSFTTFAPITFGELKPKGFIFKGLVVIEGILGWFTMAIFIVTLVNVWM